MSARMRLLALTLIAAAACATIGDETAFPDPIQTTGVGPFRLLEQSETGGRGAPTGRILQSNDPVDRSMIAEGWLFYAQAEVLTDPPERNPALPEGELDPDQLGPRRIYRGIPDTMADPDALPGTIGFEPGPMVLEASEAWEGASVFDPWVLVDEGGARLYYAADGGIGVAEASSADGTFAKVAGPILEDARAPAAVRWGDEILLFFHALDTGTIGLARSSDGRSFTEETRELDLGLEGASDLAAPGALVATTPTGRALIRLYFEATDAEGVRHVHIAASEDAATWEALPTGILDAAPEARAPAPYLLEGEVTLLVITLERNLQDVQRRAIGGAIAPAFAMPVAPPPDGGV